MILDTAMNDTRAKVLICIFLMVATFCIYSQVQDHEFINYDDYQYIKDNWKIKSGLSSESISWAFTTFYGSNWLEQSRTLNTTPSDANWVATGEYN